MPIHSHTAASLGRAPWRRLPAFLSVLALAAMSSAAHAGDIEVVAVRGEVRVAAAGAEQAAKAGTTLPLPSTVHTGSDGSTDLREGETTIGVGPNTSLEFPAPALASGPVERIVQPQGNAFYTVGPRTGSKLRVETPYLVAVIKGTQFNVALEPDSGTISLYEGSLEILAPDIGASVMLNAGEIAIRHRGDDAIRVIPMRDRTPPGASSPGTIAGDQDPDDGASGNLPGLDPLLPSDGSGPVTPIGPVDSKVAIDTEVDVGGGVVNTGVDATVGAGVAGVDAAVDGGLDLGAGTVDAGVDLGADAGLLGVDAGVDTGVDIGLGGDQPLIDIDLGNDEEESGGLLGGIVNRIGP